MKYIWVRVDEDQLNVDHKTCPNNSLMIMMNSKQEILSFEDRTLRRQHVILAFEAQDPPTVSTWVGGGTEQQGGEKIPLHNIIASILQFLHPMCLLYVIKFTAKRIADKA